MSESLLTVSFKINLPSGEIIETFEKIQNSTTLNDLLALLKKSFSC